MKHLITISALLFTLIFTQNGVSQEIMHFDENGYEAALQRSKTEHKPVLYMVYATWCQHCNKMKAEVLTDPEVKDFLTKNFVCAWQDIDKGEGEMFKQKFGVKMFPTFLFLDEKGTVLYNVNGELKSADLLNEARNALTPEKQLPYLKKDFEANPGNADKCLAYLTTLKKGKDRKDLSAPAQIYLSTQSEQQLVSAINWRIIANAVTDVNSREFQYVLKHREQFAAVASTARVQRKIVNIIEEKIRPFAENMDTIGYKKVRADIKALNLKTADSLVFKSDVIISESTGNWTAYKKATMDGAEKFAWDNATLLKQIAQNYQQHYADINSLKYAIKIAEQSEKLNESYDGYILLSRLYIKINDRKTAIDYARKAKQMTANLGWNSKDADALLQELGIQ
ncbi:thioredoxin family protein [Flavobacterium sp. 3HN19-14]|uniref:thioredoxin family protein n=1 Tax=Flavobacterium sp. 3HN19-14 TaxID=3448133 RepID=UPI003EE1356C